VSVALALLGGCGGGTSQYEAFVAQRVIAFGDESSAITSEGGKYTVNATTAAVDADEEVVYTLNCSSNPNWVQVLAGLYGYVFAECNPNRVERPQALMRATAGARVADIQAQVDAQIAAGGFRDKDLVAIMAGANDILDLYAQFPGRSEADIAAEVRSRGARMAQQVNRLVDVGAKVIVSTVPDMGLTPFALKQKAEFDDTDRAALLSRLTTAFNEQLAVNVLLDGRYIGIVQSDLTLQAMVRTPAAYGFANVTDAACQTTVDMPACTDQTLVEGASASAWMWADETRLGPSVHSQIGNLAVARARNNPF
jgi:phospholipase/lecithinase/hemolysin